MFNQNKSLAQLQTELEELNEQIALQEASSHGFIPPHMRESIIDEYKENKRKVEAQIKFHPDSNKRDEPKAETHVKFKHG
jgi:hypothetical protein